MDGETCLDNDEVPRLRGWHARTLEEVRRPLHEGRTAGILDDPGDGGDLRAAAVDALEAVEVAGSRAVGLTELVGIGQLDHGEVVVDGVALRSMFVSDELAQGLASILVTAFADQPPG